MVEPQHWQALRRKPRDLNPVHWIALAYRLQLVVRDLRQAATGLGAVGSYRTRGSVILLADYCEEAKSEAERIARRLGG
jgi:hypothetical protein